MGDKAEEAFMRYAEEQGFSAVKYGLHRPPLNLAKVPRFIRYTPDYLTSHGLVECVGLGKDQTLKLKLDKMQALQLWNAWFPVQVWVWDSHKKRGTLVDLDVMWTCVHQSSTDEFHDGPVFAAIPAEMIFDGPD